MVEELTPKFNRMLGGDILLFRVWTTHTERGRRNENVKAKEELGWGRWIEKEG